MNKSILEKLNVVGLAASIAGVVGLIAYYGFNAAQEINNVFLNTDSRDLFGGLSSWALWAGVGFFALGLILSGVSLIMRRDEVERKDMILGLGIPVLGLVALLVNFFLF